MKISTKSWKKYTGIIRRLSDKASALMEKYLESHDISTEEGIQAAIDYAYALATKYGEGAGAIACQMYEEVAEASGKTIPAAEPAATATRSEMAKAMLGRMADSNRPDVIAKTVGRKVKLVSMDTMLNNTLRDGAQFAWIPSGDSCPFCLMLASSGWKNASKKAIRNGHASHIHDNCDCNYAVRFSDDVDVEGYDPESLLEQYNDAEGRTGKEKINSMRRERYALDPEKYRAQNKKSYDKMRRIQYGQQTVFSSKKGQIHARRVDKLSYNNIYVDDNINLSAKQLKSIDKQVTEAKTVLGITNECNIPVLITDTEPYLASYNVKDNRISISYKLSNEKEILKMQTGCACPNDPRSTAVHELIHWKDANEYLNSGNKLDTDSDIIRYFEYRNRVSEILLESEGVNLSDAESVRKISQYAYNNWLENEFDEVYTEYRTTKALEVQ